MRALLAAVLLLPGSPPVSDPPVVHTHLGPVRGTVTGDHRVFRGLPYAAAPTGDLRWRAPRPAAAWTGVREATASGPACAQPPSGDPTITVTSEDCLYLDVTTPVRPGTRRPVIVWLHGGSFKTGAGSSYDPHRLAVQGDTVVVTVDYRLGVFGYLGLPGLAGSGTFGLLDQQAALRWVRRNAAAFGGDPHNVTLAGQSAGGLSVCAQLTSPGAAGLFDRAIIQSGSCLTSWPAGINFGQPAGQPWIGRPQLESAGTELAERLGCAGSLACLRALPADRLVEATPGAGIGAFTRPAHGTPLLPEHPADALRAGRFTRVPVLIGGNRDESRGMVGALDTWEPYTEEQFEAALRAGFGDRWTRVAAEYPVSDHDGRPGLAWAAVATDRMWACPAFETAALLARHTRVHGYEFAERDTPVLWDGYPWGAAHGLELPYLFDGLDWLTGTPQPALAAAMVGEWSRFAGTGTAGWPPFKTGHGTPYVRSFTAESSGRTDMAAGHRCAFWRTVPDA
ncbi:carboxylesterase/lipase family protein [Actinoplanes flavus]|uniref:Carboxylic ester hydrolase n=1 Tax=Actinoplanes flavus TaxID=2820290 RepID=A0ABS3UF03_9ACTN|nr:carboxylesterase family protein [Actinoplanes flavus]MBO3737368.1 carboxylesterase family protein [Actinoplanes flavus]